MKIGWILEGATDKAFLFGLRNRWCPGAELEKLGFRGSKLRPRNYPKACAEGLLKGCDFVVILTDSNKSDLNSVYKNEMKHVDKKHKHFTVLGIAVRNIECWICADADYVASKYNGEPNNLRNDDPKKAFEKMLGITTFDRKEDEIAKIVCQHTNFQQLLSVPSFSRFYDDVRDWAQQNDCTIPNERHN